jgi:DNA polymerase-3 subunit epsilon
MDNDNLILVFDTETQGLPLWNEPSEDERQPHIVQIAAQLIDADTRKVVQSIDLIVKPDGWEIPEEVTKIHGITTEYAIEVGIPERLAVETFLKLWNQRRRVAHVESFDARIIRIATKRYCDQFTIDAWKEGEKECTGKLAKAAMGMTKMPKLGVAYEHFIGETLENAHTAMADTEACAAIYFCMKANEH